MAACELLLVVLLELFMAIRRDFSRDAYPPKETLLRPTGRRLGRIVSLRLPDLTKRDPCPVHP